MVNPTRLSQQNAESQLATSRLKPLKWRTFCSKSGNCHARIPFGEYIVQSEDDGNWHLWYPGNDGDENEVHREMLDAITAAEAHWLKSMKDWIET